MLNRSRSRDRSRASQSVLSQILALSPSLLIWPANGSGWQGTSGGTLSAVGQPVGLLTDLAALGGKTQAEWLAAPTTPELVSNPGPFVNTTGWTNIGGTTITATGGALRVTAGGTTGGAFQDITSTAGVAVYVILRVQKPSGSSVVSVSVWERGGFATNLATLNIASSSYIDVPFVVRPTGTGIRVYLNATFGDGILECSLASIRELPGNHLRAGTWATPADSSRALLTAGGALNFDGVNDYMSLLNAISITTDMTVVRAFKRSAAGIVSQGLGHLSETRTEAVWFTDNNTYHGLGGSTTPTIGVLSTATGSFVQTDRRNATTQTIRRNGTVIATPAALTVVGTLTVFGQRVTTQFNSGEISFLAVFPTELTGANLALVEQIAAATNGTTLP